MNAVFHAGEIEAQTRAGQRKMADRVGPGIHPIIPSVAQDFLERQPMAIMGHADAFGNVWASLVTGEPGFLWAPNEVTVQITLPWLGNQPLAALCQTGGAIGILAIDLETRRRMRVNGIATPCHDGVLSVSVQQAYANCQKYIQARNWEIVSNDLDSVPKVTLSTSLDAAQTEWITEADTFFIASRHPDAGADSSHRGGAPGFVTVVNSQTLRFPDYAGNAMFNTLGNLLVNPKAGLLFVDFERGATLQFTGEATILWAKELAADFPGAERVVEFEIKQAIQTNHATSLRWRFNNYSPFNP